MQVTVEIPDTLAAQLASSGKDPASAVLEALAIDGYRTRRLSEGQIRRILGFETRMQVHALLKEHGVALDYDLDQFEKDLATLRRLRDLEKPAA